MTDNSELHELNRFMIKLSKGIDPITNTIFPNDTILNNKRLSMCFIKTSEVLTDLLDGKYVTKKITNQKNPFMISEEEKNRIQLSDEAIPISTFTYRINAVVSATNIRRLKATQITSWLMENGYLNEIEHTDGKLFKVITDKSKSIGISGIPRVNSYGRSYETIVYNKNAQKFILDNLNDIIH